MLCVACYTLVYIVQIVLDGVIASTLVPLTSGCYSHPDWQIAAALCFVRLEMQGRVQSQTD